MGEEDLNNAKEKVSELFQSLSLSKSDIDNLLNDIKAAKLYEAYILAELLKKLKDEEGYAYILKKSSKLKFKASPGPINEDYPYIEVWCEDEHIGNIYTDIEFLSLSAFISGEIEPKYSSDKHELDIMFCKKECHKYPHPEEIHLGVECKSSSKADKQMLKSILGIRREMSLLRRDDQKTEFKNWPAKYLKNSPPNCLQFYSQDEKPANDWKRAGDFYNIDFITKTL